MSRQVVHDGQNGVRLAKKTLDFSKLPIKLNKAK
jgi:hypothetical protein